MFGEDRGGSTRAEAQQRQQQYAAELRAQVAAKERQRQSDRNHSLRQSVTLLELRQAAPSAVLPVAAGNTSARRAFAAGPVAPLPPLQQQQQQQLLMQQQQQQGWAGGQQAPSAPPWQMAPHELPPPPPAPPLQPPYGTSTQQRGMPSSESMMPPPGWQPPVAQAPFGNDLQPPPLTRRPSYRQPSSSALPGLSPWGAPGSIGYGAVAMPQAGGGRMGSGPGLNQGAAREAEAWKQAAYKADLEHQLQIKQERQRQEKAAERAGEARSAREAHTMLQRAASRGYGGGSGPLREVGGQPITDLNKVRQYQAQVQAMGDQAGTGPSHSSMPGGIAAHWGPEPVMPAGYPGQEPGSHWPHQEHQYQQQMAQPQQPSDWPLPSQQPRGLPDGGGWQQGGPQLQQPQLPQATHPQQQLPSLQAAFSGTPPTSFPPSGGVAKESIPASQQVYGRMASDRPYMTASEAEKRAATQAQFKEALKQQMEEKARKKAEELQRERAMEVAEEARLAAEQERLRSQFTSDQAKQKAKLAAKEEKRGEAMESGGITIKSKPPPAAMHRQQAVQDREASTAMAVEETSSTATLQVQQQANMPPQPVPPIEVAQPPQQQPQQQQGPTPEWQQQQPQQVPAPPPALPSEPTISQTMAPPPWALPPLAAPVQPVLRSVAPPPWGMPGVPPYVMPQQSDLQHQQHQQQQQQWGMQMPMPMPPAPMPYGSMMAAAPPLPPWMHQQQQQPPLGPGMPWMPPHQVTPQQLQLPGYGGAPPGLPQPSFPWSQHPQQLFGPGSGFSSLSPQGFCSGLPYGPGPLPQIAAMQRLPMPQYETCSVLSLSDYPPDRLPTPVAPSKPAVNAASISATVGPLPRRDGPAEASIANTRTVVQSIEPKTVASVAPAPKALPPLPLRQQERQPPAPEKAAQQPQAQPLPQRPQPQAQPQAQTLAAQQRQKAVRPLPLPPQQQPAPHNQPTVLPERPAAGARPRAAQGGALPSAPLAGAMMQWDTLLQNVPKRSGGLFSRQGSVIG